MNTLNVLVIGGSGGIGAELIRQYQLWSVSDGSAHANLCDLSQPRTSSRVRGELAALGFAQHRVYPLVGEQLQQLQKHNRSKRWIIGSVAVAICMVSSVNRKKP